MRTPAEIDPYLQASYARNPIVIERGEGCRVWDTNGKEYLDFVAGIATCSLGHAHPAIRETLAQQSSRLLHVSNLYYTIPQAELAKWLIEHSCADKAFFCNSGAEANEAAIKLARKRVHNKSPDVLPVVITALQSFHGRTLATVTATGQAKYQKGFDPLMPGFEYAAYNDINALEAAVDRVVSSKSSALAAILLEPLQGEGGVTPGEPAFFTAARALCDEFDALLISDEVQAGMGRTGKLWGYENLGIEPDVITSAKGLGSGFPIGAMLAKEAAAIFQPGEHASTFGGNPLACSVATTVCNIIGKPAFLEQVNARGKELREGLEKLAARHPQHLAGSRGWGLMQGLVLQEKSELLAATISSRALEKGLLLVGAGTKVVRFVPPLIVSSAEVQRALKILDEVIAQ